MPAKTERTSLFQERINLSGILLLFCTILVLSSLNLLRLFDRFATEKVFLRQTQTGINSLIVLEGKLSGLESKFRTYLLTADSNWLDSLHKDRQVFFHYANQLQVVPDLSHPILQIKALITEKIILQDSVLNASATLRAPNSTATLSASPLVLAQLSKRSESIRKLINQSLHQQTNRLLLHRNIQDQLQAKIIWQFAAITGIVIMFLVLLFRYSFINQSKRSKAAAQMQILLSSTHEGFFLLNASWNIMLMNEKANAYLEALLGSGAATGDNMPHLYPVQERARIQQILQEALAGKTIVCEQQIELDGHSCIIELQYKAVQEKKDAKPIGISILLRDITDQKLAVEAREKSEATRHLIMNAVQDAVVCIDRDGKISYWNTKAEQIFGWSETEAIGQQLSQTIIPSYHRLAHKEGIICNLKTGGQQTPGKLLELDAVDKTGRAFPVEMFILALQGADEAFNCAFIRDISERKQSENERNGLLERLRLANSMVQLGTWQFSPASDELRCDEVVYALLELPVTYVLCRNNWFDFIHADDRERVKELFIAFANQDREVEMYFRVITPGGKVKHLYQKAVKHLNAAGQTQQVIGGVIDITRLKKAEATFRQVVNTSPNALLLVNKTGSIVLANQQAEKLFGYSVNEFSAVSAGQLLPEHYAALQKAFNQDEFPHADYKGQLVGEFYAHPKSGSPLPVEVGLSSLELEGEPLVLASVVDISQRKAAEAERLELLTRFELAADATQLGIWDLDLVHEELHWNDNMYELAAVPKGTPMTFAHWHSLIHQDDQKRILYDFEQAVKRVLPHFELDYRLVMPDGSVKVLHQKAITFCNADGVVVRCLGTSLNVTEQRQADAIKEELLTRFELAAQTLHFGLLDADLHTGNVQGDAQLKLMLGIEAIPQPDWRVWIRQVHPEDRKHLQQLLVQALPQGKLLQTEWRQLRNNGELRYFETKARMIWKSGQPSRLIAATIDITDQVNQRNELIAAKIRAEKSEQLQEQFLANMSHEIRTPLNGILGMADIMSGTMLTHRQREFLQIIQNSSQGLLTIINDVLDFSKIKAGKFYIENAPFNLHHVIISTFELLQIKASQKELTYQLQVDADVPVMVKGDAGRLSQILINLLGNAVKFTREGSVVMTVHPAGEQDGKMRLLFTVTDTGIGIAEDALQEIFNSFAQGSREVAEEFGGTGLGLAISKQLIDLQGGSIEVESTPGVGSSFRVLLAYEVEAEASEDPSKAIDASQEVRHTGKRVLVAEDNEVNRMVINEYLQKVGLHVTLVHDGRQAIETLVSQPPFDLIILDLRMPLMTGYETATLIRQELNLDTPIMALSASTLRNEKDHCLALGMNAYMAKPFKASELYDTIFRLLSGDTTQQAASINPVPETSVPAPYDLSELHQLGEPEFTLQIIDTFITNGDATLKEMITAHASAHMATVFELAHRMKSSSGTLGARALFELLRQTEAEARKEAPDFPKLGTLIEKTQQEFRQVSAALEKAKEEVMNW